MDTKLMIAMLFMLLALMLDQSQASDDVFGGVNYAPYKFKLRRLDYHICEKSLMLFCNRCCKKKGMINSEVDPDKCICEGKFVLPE